MREVKQKRLVVCELRVALLHLDDDGGLHELMEGHRGGQRKLQGGGELGLNHGQRGHPDTQNRGGHIQETQTHTMSHHSVSSDGSGKPRSQRQSQNHQQTLAQGVQHGRRQADRHVNAGNRIDQRPLPPSQLTSSAMRRTRPSRWRRSTRGQRKARLQGGGGGGRAPTRCDASLVKRGHSQRRRGRRGGSPTLARGPTALHMLCERLGIGSARGGHSGATHGGRRG